MATEQMEVYYCGSCGSLLEVLSGGPGRLSCCGRPMRRLQAQQQQDGGVADWRPQAGREAPRKLQAVENRSSEPLEEQYRMEWIEVLAGRRIRGRTA